MHYLLVVLMFTGSMLLGPALDGKGGQQGGDPWEDSAQVKGPQSAHDSGDPWVDGDPWNEHRPGRNDASESTYGAGTGGDGTAKGKPAV